MSTFFNKQIFYQILVPIIKYLSDNLLILKTNSFTKYLGFELYDIYMYARKKEKLMIKREFLDNLGF